MGTARSGGSDRADSYPEDTDDSFEDRDEANDCDDFEAPDDGDYDDDYNACRDVFVKNIFKEPKGQKCSWHEIEIRLKSTT